MQLLQIDMQLSILIAVCFAFFIVIAWLLAEFKGMKDEMRDRLGINNETLKLRLQAYERLTVFAERAGLRNMIARSEFSGQSAASLHNELIENLKSEYEYNVSQQIYVSKELWNAISKLKDQNIYIINQLAATLPHQANAMDLSKRILEYSMTDKAELNLIVLDALQFEAKKIL